MDHTRKMIRLTALVGTVAGSRKTRHTVGLPEGPQELMPLPDVVLLQKPPGEGAMIYRYTSAGEFCGDTWHETLECAKKQAAFEYGPALGEWVEIPEGVENGHDYAIQVAARREL